MARMKALRSFAYAGKGLSAGQEFDVRWPKAVGILGAKGDAEPVPQSRAAVVPLPDRSAVKVDLPVAEELISDSEPGGIAQQVEPRTIQVDGEVVNLDAMTKVQLHALAARIGVELHHNAGAEKARLAILDGQA